MWSHLQLYFYCNNYSSSLLWDVCAYSISTLRSEIFLWKCCFLKIMTLNRMVCLCVCVCSKCPHKYTVKNIGFHTIYLGQHGDSVVTTVASQKKGCWFKNSKKCCSDQAKKKKKKKSNSLHQYIQVMTTSDRIKFRQQTLLC